MTIKELYEYCTIRNIENYPIFINYETNEDEYFLSEYINLMILLYLKGIEYDKKEICYNFLC